MCCVKQSGCLFLSWSRSFSRLLAKEVHKDENSGKSIIDLQNMSKGSKGQNLSVPHIQWNLKLCAFLSSAFRSPSSESQCSFHVPSSETCLYFGQIKTKRNDKRKRKQNPMAPSRLAPSCCSPRLVVEDSVLPKVAALSRQRISRSGGRKCKQKKFSAPDWRAGKERSVGCFHLGPKPTRLSDTIWVEIRQSGSMWPWVQKTITKNTLKLSKRSLYWSDWPIATIACLQSDWVFGPHSPLQLPATCPYRDSLYLHLRHQSPLAPQNAKLKRHEKMQSAKMCKVIRATSSV